MISMIAAIGKNNELGKDNNLIWHIPNDMKFFKNTTMGHKVVMGRKTYESLPSTGLPGREMIVLTKRDINVLGDIKIVSNVDEIVGKYKNSDEEIFIIGGAMVYSEFIKYADCLYLTEINDICDDADTYFPRFDKNEWDIQLLEEDSYKDIDYKINKYVRKGK